MAKHELAPKCGLPTSTTNGLRLPRAELSACVRAFVMRSTVGAMLHDAQRHNFYPASLACSISWTLQGQTELVRVGETVVNAMAPSPVMLSGPHTVPCETRNPGPVRFFLLVFMPDAFHALTGIDLQSHTNRHCALHDVLDGPWQALAQAVMEARDDDQRIALIEAFLLPRWQQRRPMAWPLVNHGLQDWLRSLASRSATSAAGKSVRQMERRFKQWSGQTQRQLRRMVRGEDSWLQARAQRHSGELNWSALAAEKGFSDQSHLCREFRKLTGLQPDSVLQNLEQDERLWLYRVW